MNAVAVEDAAGEDAAGEGAAVVVLNGARSACRARIWTSRSGTRLPGVGDRRMPQECSLMWLGIPVVAIRVTIRDKPRQSIDFLRIGR